MSAKSVRSLPEFSNDTCLITDGAPDGAWLVELHQIGDRFYLRSVHRLQDGVSELSKFEAFEYCMKTFMPPVFQDLNITIKPAAAKR